MTYIQIHALQCCGVKEIAGISNDPIEGIMRDIVENRYMASVRCAYYLYTDAAPSAPKGKELTEFIKSHDLGLVTIAPPARNPNSGNVVTTFMWKINERNLFAWAKVNHSAMINPHSSAVLNVESWLDRYSSEYETVESLPTIPPIRFARRIRMFIKSALITE